MVINVIAEEKTLSDDTVVALDGANPDRPTTPLPDMTLAEALACPQPTGPAHCNPAVMIGGPIIPAPLLAAKIAATATIRMVIHPGQTPPEPRHRPSLKLDRFVRCRDMTCRFPGCNEPADVCDLDHTIAYPVGPTCASNLKCLCRKHHLLKTFGGGPHGWRDRQLPDGTVIWTSPGRADPHHPTRQPRAVPDTVPTHRAGDRARNRHHATAAVHPDNAPAATHPRTRPHTTHQRRTPTQRDPRRPTRRRRSRTQQTPTAGLTIGLKHP